MAVKIPKNFDFIDQKLDIHETLIKNNLKINVDNWARFRWAIHVGNDSNVLKSLNSQPIDKSVKQSYIELAKSHYEVVTSMGCIKLCLNQLTSNHFCNLDSKKNIKEFYFHVGCMVDNLARLIYIINDSKCSYELNKYKKLKRHWIDWGSLRKYSGYTKFKSSKKLNEIINIRNILTHSWSFPTYIINNVSYWPYAIRNKRDLYWPYDEINDIKKHYKKWAPIINDTKSDYIFLEKFQNNVFNRLIKDISKFEKNHNLLIT